VPSTRGNGGSGWISRPATGCWHIFRLNDLIYTHATARVPGEPGRFLINPYGFCWEEVTASSLVKIDLGGNKIDASPHRVNPAGVVIYSAVHMARQDAVCVIHTHTKAGIAVAAPADGVAVPGSYATGLSVGYPIFVLRGEDGKLRGFHNVLPSPRRHAAGAGGGTLRPLHLLPLPWLDVRLRRPAGEGN
jgi:hypothetical protein